MSLDWQRISYCPEFRGDCSRAVSGGGRKQLINDLLCIEKKMGMVLSRRSILRTFLIFAQNCQTKLEEKISKI